ncbi:MAG: hypothetical protein ABI399_02625 [Bauldia sp.]
MAPVFQTRRHLRATCLALPAAIFCLSPALAGDFVNISGVGGATYPELVSVPATGPWSDPSFQKQFPDLFALREVRVNLLPLVEPEPDGAAMAGVAGSKRRGPPATLNIRGPKITIQRRP